MTQQTKRQRPRPFGLKRHHYIAIRVFLVVGVLLLGATLHHRGVAYEAIRGVYLILIVALIVWRLNMRRHRRSDAESGSDR